MFLLFWIRQQFSSLTASHSWRLFLVVCCLLGVIDATSINRAVFSEKSFCKPCSQSLQSGGGRKERKEGRKERIGEKKNKRKKKREERKAKEGRGKEERKGEIGDLSSCLF